MLKCKKILLVFCVGIIAACTGGGGGGDAPQPWVPPDIPPVGSETYAYIGDVGASKIFSCLIGTNGMVSNQCNVYSGSGVIQKPWAITIEPSNHFAYVANGVSGGNGLLKCGINKSTGAISSCTNAVSDNSSNTFNAPVGIVLSGSVAYIADNGPDGIANAGAIFKCSVDVEKRLSGCQAMVDSPSNNLLPSGYAFKPMGLAVSGSNIYISQQGGTGNVFVSWMIRCTLGGSNLSNCDKPFTSTINNPTGLLVSNNILSISNQGNSSVAQFNLSNNQPYVGSTEYVYNYGIAINGSNYANKQIIYVANQGGDRRAASYVSLCSAPNGSINGIKCATATSSTIGLSVAAGIAISPLMSSQIASP